MHYFSQGGEARAVLLAASPEEVRRWLAAAEANDVHALFLCSHAFSDGIAGQVQWMSTLQ